jgi:ADP-heptose:LPS heptosyltransferase
MKPGRRGLARFLHRRQFYRVLPRIVLDGLRARDRRGRVFVALIGGIGDLVNLFPTLERLGAQARVDLGTGPGACAALARRHPRLHRVYTPFVYKPIRRGHRRLIERALGPWYERVILLDEADGAWRSRRAHMSRVYAERCGCPPPPRGAVYLSAEDRAAAETWLRVRGLKDFVFVAQLIRRDRTFRSWPLAHYHRLVAALRDHHGLPVVVHTVGSDETATPAGAIPLDEGDILTALATLERARLYVGPDTGLTHAAAALGVPTVSVHLGYPAEVCRALGDNVRVVTQTQPYDDPARTTPAEVLAAVDAALRASA